jgi:Ca2+-binding RTX toxin-like protein
MPGWLCNRATRSDRLARIFGGARRDVVFSSPSEPLDANFIDGGGGNDRLVGTRQFEILRGARGSDVLLAKAGDDVLKGGPGPDRLFGGRGSDILRGGPGRDLCRGGRGGEFLGPDLIRGC